MKRSLFVLLTGMLPLLSFAQEWKSFTDTAGNFTATYPANWINKIKEGNRVFFTSPSDGTKDGFYENINIKVSYDKVYSTTKVADLFPGVSAQISNSFKEFKEEGLRFFKWNNMDAAELIYSGYSQNDESVKVRCTQWFCFYRSRLYLVTFVADAGTDIHDKTAQKIMSSIVFK
ncbi:MAG: hypothetical protein IPP96_06325 [Chitinophagaceae bacterium]|nr:hypothetical protein [Chitinophagaceae bacterium]